MSTPKVIRLVGSSLLVAFSLSCQVPPVSDPASQEKPIPSEVPYAWLPPSIAPVLQAALAEDADRVRLLLEHKPRDARGRTPLHVAAEEGNVKIVKILLANGANVHDQDNAGRTPLYIAAQFGSVEAARLLLDLGANANALDHEHFSPLHKAIRSRSESLARLLLEARADPNLKTPRRWTSRYSTGAYSSLYLTVSSNQPDLVKLLLEFGARIDKQTRTSGLGYAVRRLNSECLKLLVHAGVGVDAQTGGGRRLLPEAISSRKFLAAQWLRKNGAHFYDKTEDEARILALHAAGELAAAKAAVDKLLESSLEGLRWRPIDRLLVVAAEAGRVDLIRIALAKGAGIHAFDNKALTPLHWAAIRNDKEMMRFLIKQGAAFRVVAEKEGDQTPLGFAAFYGHDRIVELLIEAGAPLDTPKEKDAKAPLTLAAENGRHSTVRLLLAKGAKYEWRALYEAASRGDTVLVDLLLDEKGKTIHLQVDSKHGAPLCAAAWNGHVDVVRQLLDAGADPNDSNFPNWSALRSAVWEGWKDVAELLIQRGASLKADHGGDRKTSPLLSAVERHRPDIVRLLLGHGSDPNEYTLLWAATNACWYTWWTSPENLNQRKDDEVVSLLLQAGADPNAKMEYSRKPLHLAAIYGSDRQVHALLKHGTRLEEKDKEGWTPLLHAVQNGHTHAVRQLLQHGANPNVRTAEGNTPLHLAAQNGVPVELSKTMAKHGTEPKIRNRYNNTRILHLLLDHGAELEAKNNDGLTPLLMTPYLETIRELVARGSDINAKSVDDYRLIHLAEVRKDKRLHAYLLKHGADPTPHKSPFYMPEVLTKEMDALVYQMGQYKEGMDAVREKIREHPDLAHGRSKSGDTLLLRAAQKGDTRMVRLLMDLGADVSATDDEGKTLLHQACTGGDLALAKTLLEAGARTDAKDAEGRTPLHITANNLEMAALLLDKGASLEAQTHSGQTPLCVVAGYGNKKAVEFLLSQGANINGAPNGSSPLHAAARPICYETARLLLDKGAHVNSKDRNGSTPLHIAAWHGSTRTARLLLEHKADVNAQANDLDTPLMTAVLQEHEDFARLLLQHNADPNLAGGHWRRTPIFYALQRGSIHFVKQLIRHKANINVHDGYEGKTPLHFILQDNGISCFTGNLDAVDWEAEARENSERERNGALFLLEHGADVNAKTENGDTPLHLAVEDGYDGVILKLIALKADINAQNNEGDTPLHNAVNMGNKFMISLLLRLGADPNQPNRAGETALYRAAATQLVESETVGEGQEAFTSAWPSVKKNKELVELLLRAGAKWKSLSQLHWAAYLGDQDMMWDLLDKGADINATDAHGNTPLHWTVPVKPSLVSGTIQQEEIDYPRVAETLIRSEAKLNPKNNEGVTAFLRATKNGHEQTALLFLNQGAQINVSDQEGLTPLHYAAREGMLPVVKLLLEKGAKTDVLAKTGTALHVAAKRGHVSVIELLLSKGSALEAVNDLGSTSLYVAIDKNQYHAAALLLKKGADANAKANSGATPLHEAASGQDNRLCPLLLDHGANINAQTNSGDTPLQWAHNDHFKILLKYNPDLNLADDQGNTILHDLAKDGSSVWAQAVVRKGAKLDTKNKMGQTPFDVAMANSRWKTAQLLRSYSLSR